MDMAALFLLTGCLQLVGFWMDMIFKAGLFLGELRF
jgi:hypothetical protein